jgi:hypothetical protein
LLPTGSPNAFTNFGFSIDALSKSIRANTGIIAVNANMIASNPMPLPNTIFWALFSYKSVSASIFPISSVNSLKFF